MKNKIIIASIFVIPLAVFAFLQLQTKNTEAVATVQSTGKGKIIKFFSPMCGECGKVGNNVKNAMKDYDNVVAYEEINVSNKDPKTQNLIETYKITVVPTVIFLDKGGNTVQKAEGMIEEIEVRENLDKIK